MLDFYRRTWQVFVGPFIAVLIGSIQVLIFLNDKWYMPLIVIPLAVLSIFLLVIVIICYVKDAKETHRKHKEANAPSKYEKEGITVI